MMLDHSENDRVPPALEFDPFFDLWFDFPRADEGDAPDESGKGIEDLVEMLYR